MYETWDTMHKWTTVYFLGLQILVSVFAIQLVVGFLSENFEASREEEQRQYSGIRFFHSIPATRIFFILRSAYFSIRVEDQAYYVGGKFVAQGGPKFQGCFDTANSIATRYHSPNQFGLRRSRYTLFDQIATRQFAFCI
jgi:hypothetical protein